MQVGQKPWHLQGGCKYRELHCKAPHKPELAFGTEEDRLIDHLIGERTREAITTLDLIS